MDGKTSSAGQLKDAINLPTAALELQKTYTTTYSLTLAGKLGRVERRGSHLFVSLAAVLAWRARERASDQAVQSPAPAYHIPGERRIVAETVGRIHQAGALRQMYLDQLAADLLEARAAGDDPLVAEITEALEVLPNALYRRTETGQWEAAVPGFGSRLSAPVPA